MTRTGAWRLGIVLTAFIGAVSWRATAADAIPTASLTVPTPVALGAGFTITATFDNTSTTLTGYGPYLDVPFSYLGADGVYDTTSKTYTSAVDGVSVAASGAVTYLGSPVTYSILTFDDTLNGGLGVPHPYAVTSPAGAPVYIKTTDFASRFQNGDKLLVIELPFGSFTPTQPAAPILIAATLSNQADMGTSMNVSARGGFRFGNDALANPSTDPSLIGARVDTSTAPALISLTKTSSALEAETATGPYYPVTYTVTIDIATGQQMTFAEIKDILPNNLQFLSLVSIVENFAEASTVDGGNQQTPGTTTPGGTIQRRLLPSGATYFTAVAGADVVLTYTAFVPRLNAASGEVIDASTGDDATSINDARGEIFWNPIDARDPDTSIVTDTTASDCTLNDRSIAIQKSVTIFTDTGPVGYSPGDTLEYTLTFQISDYFAFQNIVATDTYSDGQLIDGSYTPQMTVTEHGSTLPYAAFNGANWSTEDLTDLTPNNNNPGGTNEGGQTLTFRVSNELVSRSVDGKLVGGGVQDTFVALQNNPPFSPANGSTIGTIKFRVIIQDTFREHYPSGEKAINGNDPFANSAAIQGNLLQVGGAGHLNTVTGSAEDDATAAAFSVVIGTLTKAIYAINGDTTAANWIRGPAPNYDINVRPGDTITYRITYTLPTGDVEQLQILDYLPLPVLRADDPDANGTAGPAWVFDDSLAPHTATPPLVGRAKFGPSETFRDALPANVDPDADAPTVSVNVADGNNTLIFSHGSHRMDTDNSLRTIDILFTVTASTAPYADGLFMMNQGRATEQNTSVAVSNQDRIAGFILDEPIVNIAKGVVGYRTTGLLIGGLAFTAPGVASDFLPTPAYSATQFDDIAAASLLTNEVDAGDTVRFAIMARNAGRSDAYDVTLTDAVPTGFATPANLGAMNLVVRRGDGTLLASPADYAASLVGAALTVELTDNYTAGNVAPETGNGGLSRGYNPQVTPDSVVVAGSTANIAGFSAGSFSGAPSTLDGITLANGNRVLVKNQTTPAQNGIYVVDNAGTGAWSRATDFDAPGEITVDYRVRLNGGTTQSGRVYSQTATVVTLNTDPIVWAPYGDGEEISNGSNVVIITYDLTVAATAEALDTATNTATLTNYSNTEGGTDFTTDNLIDTASVNFRPASLAKTRVSGASAVIGQIATYTLTVTVPEGVTAAAVVTDTLPAGLAFRQITSTVYASGVTSTNSIGTGVSPANVTVAPGGQSLTFNFGDITNGAPTDTSGDKTIAITYEVVVLNILGNQATTTLHNAATFDYTNNGAPLTAAAADTTVIEPTLTVGKQVSLTQVGGYATSLTGGMDAGDTIYFQVTIANGNLAGDITAYDLYLSDTFNAKYSSPTILTVSKSGTGNVYVNGVAGTPATTDFAFTGQTLNVAGASNIDMEKDTSLVITCSAVLDVSVYPTEAITNNATIRWSSRDGDVVTVPLSTYNTASIERTGDTLTPAAGVNPAQTDQSILDNYAATSANSTTTITAPVLVKALAGTEINTADNSSSQAVIGELVTYTLTVTVPEITMSNVQIVDTMAPGLSFVDVTSVVVPANVTPVNTIGTGTNPTNVTIANDSGGTANKLTFNFGNIVNSNSSNGTPELIVITFRAVVLDVTAGSAPYGNQAGVALSNSATLSYTNGTPLNSSATNVTIIEPTLTVAKGVAATDAGPFNATLTGQDYANPVYYQIVITNPDTGADTTAFDLELADSLPPTFVPDGTTPINSVAAGGTGTIWVNATARAPVTSDFAITGTPGAYVLGLKNIPPLTNIDMGKDSSITIILKGSWAIGVLPGVTYNNTATVRWSSLDGAITDRSIHNGASDERTGGSQTPAQNVNLAAGTGNDQTILDNYAASAAQAGVTMTAPVFVKTVTGTEFNVTGNGQFQAVIGEKVTYTLTVTVPEGTMPAVVIKDTLDQGLAFVNLISTTPSSGVAIANNPATVAIQDSGVARSVWFTLGNVVNSNTGNSGTDTVTLVFEAIVLNQNTLPAAPGNQTGTTLGNTAALEYTGGSTPDSTPVQLITIVEPALTLTKQIAPEVGSAPGTYANTLGSQDFGNAVYYRVVISNASGLSAFDLGLTDVFSPKLTTLTIYSATSTGTTVNSTGRALAPADFLLASNTLSFAAGLNVDLATTGSITVEIRALAVIGVTPGEVIDNTATVTWTSMDGDVSAARTANNASSTERTGAGGVGTDTAVLNNYAAQNVAGTGRLTIANPVVRKTVITTSESHTVQNRVLADFENTGFNSTTDTWISQTTNNAHFITIGGTATENGSGTVTLGSIDLTGHASIGVVARLASNNTANNIWLYLTDADGTVARYAVTFPGPLVAGAPGFNQTFASLLNPSIPTPGTTVGLDLSKVTAVGIGGDGGGGLFRMDIDSIQAIRTIAVPGEIVRFRLITEIPEGTSPDLMLRDSMPAGLRFINDSTVRVAFVSNGGGAGIVSTSSQSGAVPAVTGTGLNQSGNGDDVSALSLLPGTGTGLAIGEGSALFDANVSSLTGSDVDTYNNATTVYFKLGNVTNNDSDADAEYVIVEFNAQAHNDRDAFDVNDSLQQAGAQPSNRFVYRVNGADLVTSAASCDFCSVTLAEPQINDLAKKILTAPVDAGDAVVYEMSFYAGPLHPSQYLPTVRVATTADIVALGAVYTTGGAADTGRFSGAPASLDGLTLAENDLVLVKDQTDTRQNGIYKVVDAINRVWDRASSFDVNAEVSLGYRVYVTAGTTQTGFAFSQDTASVALNTTAVTFSRVSSSPVVKVATTAVIGTGFDPGNNQITGVVLSSGNLIIDGVTLAVNDRVLVKNQGTPAQNGVYVVTAIGATATLTRTDMFNQSYEFALGRQVFVQQGNGNAQKTFAVSFTAPFTLNTTSNSWIAVDQVTAFDLVLTDPLPAEVLFSSVTITTPTATYTTTTNGSFSGGAVTVPAVGATGTVTVTLDSLAPALKISGTPTGVTITVSGTVATSTAARTELANTAKLTFTSLPGPKGTAVNLTGTDPTTSSFVDASGGQYGERDGSGYASPTDTTPYTFNNGTQRNNYSIASTVVTSLARPEVDKAFQDGTLTADDTDQSFTTLGNVAIGEKVTYDILVTLPEGQTNGLVVTDAIPVGIRVDSYALVTRRTGAAPISAMLTADFSDPGTLPTPTLSSALPTSTSPLTFTFGTVNVTPDGSASNNAFVIRVSATVYNLAGNINGVTRTNSATLTFTDGLIGTRTLIDSTPANDPAVTIVEPALALAKDVTPAYADPVSTPLTVTLTLTNSGATNAYDVIISDPLPATFDEATRAYITPQNGFDVAYVAGTRTITFTAQSGVASVPGVPLVFTYTINFTGAGTPGQVITNTATVTQADTIPGANLDQRDKSGAQGSDDVTLYSNSVSGYVYRDADNDGVKDGGEAAVSGVTITLTGTDHLGNAVTRTATTNGSGYYEITGLGASNGSGYTLTETQPSGYLDGKETVGTGFGGSAANTANSQTITTLIVPLGANGTGANYNFGDFLPTSLSGKVFVDVQKNGTIDPAAGDLGIRNVTVTLTGTDDLGAAVNTVLTTDASGNYSFSGLRPGTYTITETQPPLYTQGTETVGSAGGTNSAINVISGIVLATDNITGINYNFAEYGELIMGRLYKDMNATPNGQYDAGTDIPIANVDVWITKSDGTQVIATTDVNGIYRAGVSAGVTIVDVNTADPDFPATYRRLTTNAFNEGKDPVTLTVVAGVTAVQHFGYILGDPTPCYDFHGEANALAAGGILATWRTGAEQGVYKFVLERRSAGAAWEKLTELFSTAAEFKGASYRYLDRSALPQLPYEYQVQAVDNDGSSLTYRLGSATATAQLPAVTDQRGAPGQLLAATLQRGDPTPVPQAMLTPLTFAVATYATDTPVQTGTASRANVAGTGLYTVPGADPVYDAGMPLPRLSGNLVFVRALSDAYTDTNVIWNGSLTINGTPGQVPAPPVQGLLGPSGYIGVFHVERNESFTVNQYLPAGPNWYFSRDYELSTGSVRTLAVPVTSPRAGQAEILVAVRATSPDAHDLKISVNGTAVGQASWTGSGHYSVKAEFDAALLVNGSNQVALETTAAGSTKRLDYVEIRTPATPVLGSGTGLLVRVQPGAAGTLTVPGAKYAVDATHFGAEALLPLAVDGAVAGLTAGRLVYFCQAPQSLTWSAPLTLDSSALAGQSYVAVAPAALKTAVAPLVQFHKDQGLNATTITLEDVQNIFGGGWFGPAGLVRLAAFVQPRFLLLAAGTTYDCKNYEGLNTPVGIPCGWVQTYDGMAASDDLYTNGFKVAVGRLPVRTATELSAIVAKTLTFDPGQRAVLLAGIDSAVAGYDQFAELQASLAGILPSTTITSTGRDPAVVRQELIQSIADGGRLVTYQGHGGTDALGPAAGVIGPTVLTGADIPSLPVSAWVLATCLTGTYFVNDPSIPVLSLEMLAAPGAGAVAVICSTRYGDASVNDAVVNLALQRMAQGPTTWGSVLLYLKQQLGSSDTAKVYTLLGDPALPTLQVDDRRITLRSPQTGAAFGRDPVQIRFRLSGQNWATEKLGVWYRPENGAWTLVTEIQVQPGTLEYQWPWEPPGEGRYQIKIEESAGGAR